MALALLKKGLAAIPSVRREPAPDVEIVQLNPAARVLAVRRSFHKENCWQVYFGCTG